MLADETYGSAIKVTVEGAQVTAAMIKAVIAWLANRGKNKPQFVKGKQSLKKLLRQDVEMSNVPLSEDIKGIKKALKKMGVDFAVGEGDAKDTKTIWFRAKDADIIHFAMESYSKRTEEIEEKKAKKIPIKERMKKAMAEAAEKAKERFIARGPKSKTAAR